MKPPQDQLGPSPKIVRAIVSDANSRGVPVKDYLERLRHALIIENGAKHEQAFSPEELSLAGSPFEDVEDLIGAFDSREPVPHSQSKADATVTLEEVRASLSKIPFSLSEEASRERDER